MFGKVIGGGMPLAAFGGKRDMMEQLAPLGPVYQAGTLSGNPVATACGLATLREIAKPGFFDALVARAPAASSTACSRRRAPPACRWSATAKAACSASSSPPQLPQNYGAVMATDKERFNRFFHAMLDRGVYLAPALYEAGFVSAAHSARRHRRHGRCGAAREPGRAANRRFSAGRRAVEAGARAA